MNSTKLDKAEVARRQLGAALALFLQDQDPVSVHVLACSGGEVAEGLAKEAGGITFRSMREQAEPALVGKDYTNLKSLTYNALKHYRRPKWQGGAVRDDTETMASFTDQNNREALFIGWWDFKFAGLLAPIEAEIFSNWFLAIHPETLPLSDEAAEFVAKADRDFGPLVGIEPWRQKRRLIQTIRRWRNDPQMRRDAGLDLRPLILGSPWG